MPNHFSSIGFSIHTSADIGRLLAQIVREGIASRVPQGQYIRWSPGNGVELWLQIAPEGRINNCAPYFAGTSRLRGQIARALPKADYPLEGGFYIWSLTEGQDRAPFMIDAPNYQIVAAQLTYPQEVTIQLAAFAHDITVFSDEASYLASQDPAKPRFAPNHFIPSGLFTKGQQPPQAHGFGAATVLATETRLNTITQTPFQYLRVSNLIGEFDLVADTMMLPTLPAIGSIIQASFWLTGLIEDITEAAR